MSDTPEIILPPHSFAHTMPGAITVLDVLQGRNTAFAEALIENESIARAFMTYLNALENHCKRNGKRLSDLDLVEARTNGEQTVFTHRFKR
jgi:hypothetical protein